MLLVHAKQIKVTSMSATYSPDMILGLHLLKVIFICKQVHCILDIFGEFIILIYYNQEFIFYDYEI